MYREIKQAFKIRLGENKLFSQETIRKALTKMDKISLNAVFLDWTLADYEEFFEKRVSILYKYHFIYTEIIMKTRWSLGFSSLIHGVCL